MANPRRRPSHYRRKAEGDTPAQTQVIKHGMYTSPQTMDGRCWQARLLKRTRTGLLEGFPEPAPFRVQTIADMAALKLFKINAYQANVISGADPSDRADDYCLALMNSVLRDLVSLEQLAKQYAPTNCTPTLQEYLKKIQSGQLLQLEGEKE